MSELLLGNEQVLKVCRNATISAFEGKVEGESLNQLLCSMQSVAKEPGRAIKASADLVSAVIWSKVRCEPEDKPWIFHEDAWGPSLGGGSCIGVLYHAYEDVVAGWDYFFEEAAAYHAQGAGSIGGVFQITWFKKNGTPIGQFNGFMSGAGAFEIGGSCKWQAK